MRIAEVILNRAEAYAKLADAGQPSADGRDPKTAAIEDVNIIRARTGLSGSSLYTLGRKAVPICVVILFVIIRIRCTSSPPSEEGKRK